MTTEAVWNDYSQSILRYFKARVQDEAIAEDLRQEVFIKVHQGLDRLKESEKLAHWLSVISRNALVDHWKRQAHHRVHEPVERIPEEREDDRAFRAMAEQCVTSMIRTLPEAYALPLTLSDLEGVRQAEVAQRMGLSLSGAKSRIQRGRKLLREAIMECCRVELNARGEWVDAQCMHDPCTACSS